MITGEPLARACALAADDTKAENIRVWDMRGVSSLTDYMVVCCGTSKPHLKALLRETGDLVRQRHGVRPFNSEGGAETRWVVLDYIDVMVHIMDPELREYYGLEELWADAREIDWRG